MYPNILHFYSVCLPVCSHLVVNIMGLCVTMIHALSIENTLMTLNQKIKNGSIKCEIEVHFGPHIPKRFAKYRLSESCYVGAIDRLKQLIDFICLIMIYVSILHAV